MADKIYTHNCSDSDILSFDDEACKISKFKRALWKMFYYQSMKLVDDMKKWLGESYNLRIEKFGINRDEDWFTTGKDCQILKPGKEWQSGKVRVKLTLEFIPDEPEVIEENGCQNVDDISESPLDEIRQQLTHEN